MHEEDAVRRCFFSVTRDEQNHEQMCGMAITKFLGHPDPITYEPKTEIGKRLQKNAKWLYYNGGRYWNGYKKAVPKYSLGVLFSSFLMGEIAAATIFKQMHENSRELVFKEAFKNIGRDEGRHMAICMALMERDYPGMQDDERALVTKQIRAGYLFYQPFCLSRPWSSGTYPTTLLPASVKQKKLLVMPVLVCLVMKPKKKTGAMPCWI